MMAARDERPVEPTIPEDLLQRAHDHLRIHHHAWPATLELARKTSPFKGLLYGLARGFQRAIARAPAQSPAPATPQRRPAAPHTAHGQPGQRALFDPKRAAANDRTDD